MVVPCSEEDVLAWLTDHDLPEPLRPVPKVWLRLDGGGHGKIWVKVTHPLGQWSQFVRHDSGEVAGEERVFAPTDPKSGQQVPVPMKVTPTLSVDRALRQPLPSIAKCTPDEVVAFLVGAPSTEPGGGLGDRDPYQAKQHASRPHFGLADFS
jgi:hypothetical protein